jgi:mRNA interferase MazF
VIVAAITSNLSLAGAPGNFAVSYRGTGLSMKSVVNVSQLLTLTKSLLTDRIGRLDGASLQRLDDGLRLVLAL